MRQQQLDKTPDARVVQMWIYQMQPAGYYMIATVTNIGLKSTENARVSFTEKYIEQSLPLSPKSLKSEYIENYIWQLHMGAWMGQVGKLFTFLCGLVCTSLTHHRFYYLDEKRKEKQTKEARCDSCVII